MKKILFVMRSTPYQGILLQEKLDIVLTVAAFDQQVELLFVDDGVFQLKKGQYATKEGLKSTATIFQALALYDITQLYIESESMHERGLVSADLSLAVQEVERAAINSLMGLFDVVMSA